MAAWLVQYGLACFAKSVRARPTTQATVRALSCQCYLSGPVVNSCGTRQIPTNRQCYTEVRAPSLES
eukprot:4856319-Alexandrium_andersonii.AAC.1